VARGWRQGDQLPLEAMREFDSNSTETDRIIVCSHSCDLQRMQGEKLFVVRGKRALESEGSFIGAKSIYTLELRTASGKFIHYDIESLQRIDAGILDRHVPWSEESHDADDRVALGAWLGQRFDRLALPDQVINAINESGIRRVIEDKLKRAEGILDVRIFLDEHGEPPTIAFLLVYDSGISNAEETAKSICESITGCASKNQSKLEGSIVFESAKPISDSALRYTQFRITRPWRVEHLSLRTTPPGQRPVK
jgi:hypothetical protein